MRNTSYIMKKVNIGRKPERGRTTTPEAAAEAWVTDRQESGTENRTLRQVGALKRL